MPPLPHPPGTLLAFPTQPLFDSSSPPTGRWGTILVLRHEEAPENGTESVVSILDHVLTHRPTVAAMAGAGVMDLAGNLSVGGDRALTFRLLLQEEDRPRWPALEVVGHRELTTAEAGRSWHVMVPATALSFHVEMAWRYDHDREALEREMEERRQKAELQSAERERRERERLRGLTIQTLLAETQFTEWEETRDFIPSEFLDDLRLRARAMLTAIEALGPKPRRPAVRAEMKAFVEWVNAANAESDADPVATMEREELFAFLEEVAWAAKQRPLVEEVDDWRDW
ncbi:MAG: hypothetical protein AAF844_14445 [Pseudomonadota bacterium]